jgi:hypothetical protein
MTNTEVPAKQGMGTGAKIAIGCGAVAVLSIVVVGIAVVFGGLFVAKKVKDAGFDSDLMARNPGLAAARMLVTANPELDLVDMDEAKGTLTIRNKETGETLTVDFKDIQEGRLTFSTEEGEVTFRGDDSGARMEVRGETGETQTVEFGASADPSRIPDWIPLHQGDLNVGFTATDGGKRVGMFSIETTASRQDARDFYVAELDGRGFTHSVSSMEGAGMAMISISASHPDGTRELTVLISEAEGKTTITLNYEQEG